MRFGIERTLLQLIECEGAGLFGVGRRLIVVVRVEGGASHPRVGLDVFGRDAVSGAVGI